MASFGYIECKGDKWDCKERGSGRVFREGKFELLALTEIKLNGARRIKSEKWREHQYIEGYARCFANKRVE